MNRQNAERLNSLISNKASGWLEKAQWREENEAWLPGALRKNKKFDIFPKTQKELATSINCSPKYVDKILKGSEDLQLKTISQMGRILNIKMLEVPEN